MTNDMRFSTDRRTTFVYDGIEFELSKQTNNCLEGAEHKHIAKTGTGKFKLTLRVYHRRHSHCRSSWYWDCLLSDYDGRWPWRYRDSNNWQAEGSRVHSKEVAFEAAVKHMHTIEKARGVVDRVTVLDGMPTKPIGAWVEPWYEGIADAVQHERAAAD